MSAGFEILRKPTSSVYKGRYTLLFRILLNGRSSVLLTFRIFTTFNPENSNPPIPEHLISTFSPSKSEFLNPANPLAPRSDPASLFANSSYFDSYGDVTSSKVRILEANAPSSSWTSKIPREIAGISIKMWSIGLGLLLLLIGTIVSCIRCCEWSTFDPFASRTSTSFRETLVCSVAVISKLLCVEDLPSVFITLL
jgi:hypothetical protein